MPVELWQGDWSFLLQGAWDPSHQGSGLEVEHPRLVWSGDGGSVAVGGALAPRDEIAALVQSGDLDAAVRSFPTGVPSGILQPSRVAELAGVIPTGVREEVEALPHPDPLRRFHLFLLLNDQRRHLDGHFETLDLHGLEFHLPFFDFAFMKKLAAVPMERLRKHRFYHEWLHHFPEVVRTVPWQTYPTHLPCPLPQEGTSPDQWSGDQRSVVRTLKRRHWQRRRSRIAAMAMSRHFPADIVNRPRFLAAGMLDMLGIRNYHYAVDFVHRLFVVNGAGGSAD
jgi:hypothetical protein